MQIMVWVDKIEITKPMDEWRTYRPGKRHAALVIEIPWWLAARVGRWLTVFRREDHE